MWRILAAALLACAGCSASQPSPRPAWRTYTDHIFQSTDDYFSIKGEGEGPPPAATGDKAPSPAREAGPSGSTERGTPGL